MKAITVLIYVLLIHGNFSITSSLKISLYYESFCSNSINFVVGQLYPTYKQFGDVLIPELVPYGYATTKENDGKYSFTCQHGPKECLANKIQSCANALLHASEALEFANCMLIDQFGSHEIEVVARGRECSEEVKISWKTINICLTSGQGDKLLANNGLKTDVVGPKSLPTILFNEEYNETLQLKAETNLFQTLCTIFEGELKPSVCLLSNDISHGKEF